MTRRSARRRLRTAVGGPAAGTGEAPSGGSSGDDLPAALDRAAACLAAGLPPAAALRAAARGTSERVGRRLAGIATCLERDPSGPARADDGTGGAAGDADDDWAEVSAALVDAVRSGARPARRLRELADELRRRRRATALARTQRFAVLAVVPLGCCFLPAFVLVGVVPVALALLRMATG